MLLKRQTTPAAVKLFCRKGFEMRRARDRYCLHRDWHQLLHTGCIPNSFRLHNCRKLFKEYTLFPPAKGRFGDEHVAK